MRATRSVRSVDFHISVSKYVLNLGKENDGKRCRHVLCGVWLNLDTVGVGEGSFFDGGG